MDPLNTSSKLFYTRKDIAEYLGISRKTLYNRLKKQNISLHTGMLNREEFLSICQILGVPLPEQGNGKKT